MVKEFHLFAGIGGGIYGGQLLNHKCVGGVEIDKYCQSVLRQRQMDGWMEKFDIYGDITTLNGADFKGKFDVLCGGFPCQAFSHAAHGKNISEKNLWPEMRRFVIESQAHIVFGENVTEEALNKAKQDLIELGYKVYRCKVSCEMIGADHRRDRYWLLAVYNYDEIYDKVINGIKSLPVLKANSWLRNPHDIKGVNTARRLQLKCIGNAQSPYSAATAFRILLNRHIHNFASDPVIPSKEELSAVFYVQPTWIKQNHPEITGFVHTPTTMANYCCKSMMKHQGCRNYKAIFNTPMPKDAEYLMGFPIGASSAERQLLNEYELWNNQN